MTSTVRAAITQTRWAGDEAGMLDGHERLMRDAASAGAQVICFQELFHGPYFGVTQERRYYAFAQPVDGPIVRRFAALAAELGMVTLLPIYEEAAPGLYYNTCVVIDADGAVLGAYRKNHIPHVDRFWEKFYFRPGNLGYPVFDTAVGRVGVAICYDRHFPESWRCLALDGVEMIFNPSASAPGISDRLWEIEQAAAAAANGCYVLAPNRVGAETGEFGELAVNFYGRSQVRDPRGELVGDWGSDTDEEVLIRDLDLDLVRQTRDLWQFLRDRRPDTYESIVRP